MYRCVRTDCKVFVALFGERVVNRDTVHFLSTKTARNLVLKDGQKMGSRFCDRRA